MASPVLLVAEDNPCDALLLQRVLERSGSAFRMMRVCDGDEAIAYLEGSGTFHDREAYPPPQVVLLDLKMPATDGFDVLHWRQTTRCAADIPVVVFSSSELHEDVQRAYALGANSYILKTASPQRLELMVKALTAWWGDFNVIIPPSA